MPSYQFSAKTLESKKVSGRRDAPDEKTLITQLRSEGLYPLQVKEAARASEQSGKLKTAEISEFCREIGTMLASGISLVRAMEILLQRSMKPMVHMVYESVYVMLQQGHTLSEAMSMQGNAFPELLINMFRAGENSGQLERTALKMADHFQKEHKLHSKLKNAATYPVILIILTVAIMILIFTVVLPTFFDLFEGIELPIYTQIVIAISNFLTQYWYVLLIIVLLVTMTWILLLRISKVRIAFDHFKLRLPKIGKLFRTIYTARFARTLCSLYSSGISLVNAIGTAVETVGNRYISSQFEQVIRDVRAGKPLSQAIQQVEGLDPKLKSIIYIGEESGRLDEMLSSAADSFDYDAEIASQRMVTIMEPLMIVIMAVIIGVVMISVMVPIYTLYQSIESM